MNDGEKPVPFCITARDQEKAGSPPERQVQTLKFLNGATAANLFQSIGLPLPDNPNEETAPLPPVALPFPRPGKTVELELTSAAEAETEDFASPSPFRNDHAKVVKVSPQDPPIPGEFQYDPNAPAPVQRQSGYPRSQGKEITIVYDSPRIELGAEIETVVITDEQTEPTPDWVPSIEPRVLGQWVWLDTSTLQFQADEEFARATTFQIKTPCNTRWSFTTAPPTCGMHNLGHEVDLQPRLEVYCDLDTDWEAQQEYVVLLPEVGTDPIPLEHVETRKSYYSYGVFRPCRPLERDTTYRFGLLTGVKSLVGPNPSMSQHTMKIKTYGDLKFTSTRAACRPAGYAINPSEKWEVFIGFTNRLSAEAFEQDRVQVHPPLDEMQITVSGNSLCIRGESPGGMIGIKVSSELQDLYGQRLGQNLELEEKLERPGAFYFLNRGMRVLPVQNPTFTFFVQSIPAVEVVVYVVRPEQWPDYVEFLSSRNGLFSGSGKRKVLTVKPSPTPQPVHLDLESYLDIRPGHLVLQVRAQKPGSDQSVVVQDDDLVSITCEPEPEYGDWQSCWIQVTDLCPALIQSFDTIRRRVVDGRTGRLLENTSVSTLQDRLPHEYFLVGVDNDRAFFRADAPTEPKSELVVYGFTDRRLYKPEETVAIKLWAWERPAPGRVIESASGKKLKYQLRGPDWSYALPGELELSAESSADLELKLPKELKLGNHVLMFGFDDSQMQGEIPVQIEEFRRPKFEVKLGGPESSEIGQTLTYKVTAQSFSGADLSGATSTISFNRKPVNYRPPGWPRFFFGHRSFWFGFPVTPETSQHVRAELDSDGSKTFDLILSGLEADRSYVVEAHSNVVDLDRQQQSASHRHIVHSSSLDLGIQMSRIVYDAKDDISFQFIVTDHQGRPVSGQRVQFKVEDEDYFDCVSQAKPSGLTLKTERRGYLNIYGRVIDERGLMSSTKVIVYRLGGYGAVSEEKELSALLDKQSYFVGEEARLTLLCPQQGTFFLRVVNGGEVHYAEGFAPEGEYVLDFPVTEALRGGGKVHLDLVTPGDSMGPKVYRATQEFEVEVADRELRVEVTPSQTLAAPGDAMQVAVHVLDREGNPVADAEVALVVVDEAILFAGGYRIPEPLKKLYPAQQDRTQSRYLWEESRMPDLSGIAALMQREHNRRLACSMASPPADGSKPSGHVRKNFAPLVHFAPSLKTDSEGRVRTDFTLPDSLSKFRITAVVVTTDRDAGYAECQIQATKPVLLETSFPRFLSPGDRSLLPVTVRNLTDKQRVVEVALRGTGIRLLEEAAATLTLEPKGALEVPFRVEVKDVPELVIQSMVKSGCELDAVEEKLPVYRAATTETVAQCGQLVDQACSFGLHWPARAVPGFGGLSVELSTTALQGLDGAYRYILNYSYSCLEQLASKVAATVSLNDYLDAYQPEGVPARGERDVMMEGWLKQILDRKRGLGFSYWPGGTTCYDFPNLVTYHALAMAHQAGYSAPGLTRTQVQQDLRSYKLEFMFPGEIKAFFEAYLLWIRALWGDESARDAVPSMKDAGVEAWTFMMRLSPRWRAEGVRLIQNSVTETATTASFRQNASFWMRYAFGGLQRSNAFALSALLEAEPDHPLVSKFMTGLQAHRVQGRWRNTQENLFAILALGSYFKIREADEPDLRAAAWLGERQFVGRAFKGRETERFRAHVLSDRVSRANPPTVILQSAGKGRLYHRTELTWAVDCLEVRPLSRGFTLERSYTLVSGDGQSERQLDPGSGPLKVQAGDKLRVLLKVYSGGPRYHVALVDPFPGGFEPLNPRLKSQGQTQVRRSWSWEHWQMRDHQLEVFASYISSGHRVFEYEVRATTPGTFQLRPAKIEEMYAPETLARTEGGTVVVGTS